MINNYDKVNAIVLVRHDRFIEVEVDLSKLTHLKTIEGSIRNPDMQHHCYTNASQRYYLYGEIDESNTEVSQCCESPQFSESRRLIIVSENGNGRECMIVQYCDQGNSILYAAHHFPEVIVHDILNSMFFAYSNGFRQGNDTAVLKYKTAFVRGSLKKRKDRGKNTVKVWIDE